MSAATDRRDVSTFRRLIAGVLIRLSGVLNRVAWRMIKPGGDSAPAC